MTYTIFEIAKILNIKKAGLNAAHINYLLTDSRNLLHPEETLFFAIATSNNDGHKYVQELYESGVRNFVVQELHADWERFDDANFLIVKDSLAALQKIAAVHRKKFDIPIIAITGSNGKTVVKEWIYQLIGSNFNVTRSPRSYNSQIGVPLSVWQLNENTQVGLFEAGISQPGEMEKLETIITPTIGVLTNVGEAHQENFETLKQKCLEKLELFINCDVIICEEDNHLIEECMEIACLTQKRLTWSKNMSGTSPLQIKKITKKDFSTQLDFIFLQYGFSTEIPFTDDASIENAMSAIAVAFYLHVPTATILEKLSQLEPVRMRLDVRSGKNNTIIINDTYNSDYNSLSIALDFLQQRSTLNSLKRLLILSDIPQSGTTLSSLYHRVADLLQQKKIDKLIGIGKDISKNKNIFKSIDSSFFESTDDFISSRVWANISDEMILLKGARSFGFEKINELLEVKSHETVLDVNLDAIVHNFNFYRSRLGKDTRLICMVKADAYGSGDVEVAKTLQHHKCDYLAVAVADEGVLLRQGGIKVPIIVLNPEVRGFDNLFSYNLEPEVYNFRILDAFIKEASNKGARDYPIHIKIDTGMHRLGFTKEDIPALVERMKNQNYLSIKSCFSHLAASESWTFDDFTTEQIKTFKEVAGQLERQLGYRVMKHILNSAGIERFPEEQMDMVRLGISLYGVSASGLSGLRNVCTLKTTILQIKEVPKGETVGYGRKGVMERDSRIATIRIGYADGLDRHLGNGVGKFLVNGQLAPLVGNVCMDLCMLDITNIPANEGDTVIVFGEELNLVDMAKSLDTIPYEILTSVSSRVKRIYYKE
ncbi:bifunctional UDP-N-acetylmuramoyl-tripeptide:D-alanyl-D-alanine ligase/alanine racemase [Dysgonomonas sp. 520]|uniref:bifunctional UDP-N-acetylmuramoyl-tripeptide:D-alanyl-D-alanine ligase/alanine racemase n=1 Tax=Dysgonomonas sp. 520 TaxID=2302931 RepID=UPI0013D11C8B|nr:bifunctional UDP-N-acetylmuramoyl-tripeptide:D-alanyl-D-alanine ligase/alanine racemase [Dysgonomonas sp. 520]NDW10540.1 bifunctional UDP-N-acetylmuramoyl-tripeptide:D-alanyl-D-alanine ligase/alanine racemase [Dysgonomonas sp. 520]